MPTVNVARKNFDIQYRGAAPLSLNLTNAPWLDKILKIYRCSTGTALAVQSYAGAFNGATPGGAVTVLMPGFCYRIVAAVYNGSWEIPDSVLVDDIPFEVESGGTAPPLAAPTNLQTIPAGENALTAQNVTANSVAGATGYNLFYSPAANGLYTMVASNLSIPTFTHTGRTAGRPGFYKYQAIGNGTTNSSSVQSAAKAVTWKDFKLCFDGNSIMAPGYADLAGSIVTRFRARLVAAGDTRGVHYDLTDGILENVSISGQTEQQMVDMFSDMAATYDPRFSCIAVTLERYNIIRGYSSSVTAQQAFDKFVEYDELIQTVPFVAHIAYTTPPDKITAATVGGNPEYRTRPDFVSVQMGIATLMEAYALNSSRIFLANIARWTKYDPADPSQSGDGVHPNQNGVDNYCVAEVAEHALMQYAYGIPLPAPQTSGAPAPGAPTIISTSNNGQEVSEGTVLEVNGTRFDTLTSAKFNNVVIPYTFVSATKITMIIRGTDRTGVVSLTNSVGTVNSNQITVDYHKPVGQIYLRPLVDNPLNQQGTPNVFMGNHGDYVAVGRLSYDAVARTGDMFPAGQPFIISTEYHAAFNTTDALFLLSPDKTLGNYQQKSIGTYVSVSQSGAIIPYLIGPGQTSVANSPTVVDGIKFGVYCPADTLEMRYAWSTDKWATAPNFFGPSLGIHNTDLYVMLNPSASGRGDFTTTLGAVATT